MILVVPVTDPKPESPTWESQPSVKAARDAVYQALAFVRVNQICQEMM